MGDVADRFVEFPVTYVDLIEHLPNAIADSQGVPRIPTVEPRRIAGDEDMWVEELPSVWVDIVASVDMKHMPALLDIWGRLSHVDYESDASTWNSPTMASCLLQLVGVASLSLSRGKPLLGLFAV